MTATEDTGRNEAGSTGPLAGVRVVELAIVIAGPAAGAVLSDMGAEVIKLESREGDVQRGNLNPAYFSLDNRNKRSVSVNLKSDAGREIAYRLLDQADVFLSNIRASALRRLGLDYDTVAARNPRLIYALVTGYGNTGPFADKPGFDLGGYWSRSGVAAALVGEGNEPMIPRPGIGDHPTAMNLVAGVNAALYQRERTGQGQFVTTSLLRSGMYTIASDLAGVLNGMNPEIGMRRMLYNPLFACYQAGDGKWFWLLGFQPSRHWAGLCRAVGRPELADDKRFRSHHALIENRNEALAILDSEFAKHSRDEWAEIFTEHDVWWDPVLVPAEAVDDPAVVASRGIWPVEGGSTIASPVDFSSCPPPPVRRAPETGEHTEEVLLEMGYDWDQIVALKDDGAIP
jgi:crotonobetainyl-CoA:carnitine CoA-transferase CaiB-like acyl-CoA transferase